jgi:hypothetical protein
VKVSKIEEARKEALRFVDLATKLLRQSDKESLLYGSALSGSMKRASLDLSRSLSEMRKP